MPRPSTWHSPTTAVRIPGHAVPQCMALARQLDQPQEVLYKTPQPYLISVDDQRYLLAPEPVSPEESAAIDQAVERLMESSYSQDDLLWMIGAMAERTLKPL